jgi:hypothetical protein
MTMTSREAGAICLEIKDSIEACMDKAQRILDECEELEDGEREAIGDILGSLRDALSLMQEDDDE